MALGTKTTPNSVEIGDILKATQNVTITPTTKTFAAGTNMGVVTKISTTAISFKAFDGQTYTISPDYLIGQVSFSANPAQDYTEKGSGWTKAYDIATKWLPIATSIFGIFAGNSAATLTTEDGTQIGYDPSKGLTAETEEERKLREKAAEKAEKAKKNTVIVCIVGGLVIVGSIAWYFMAKAKKKSNSVAATVVAPALTKSV